MIDSRTLRTGLTAVTALRSAWLPALRATLRAGAPVAGIAFGVESLLTAAKFHQGKIDADEAIRQTKSAMATNVAGLGMAAVGAAVGTVVFPGTGTMVGSIVGGMLGGKLGSLVFKKPDAKTAPAKEATI
jgi:phage tail tape-measure protein